MIISSTKLRRLLKESMDASVHEIIEQMCEIFKQNNARMDKTLADPDFIFLENALYASYDAIAEFDRRIDVKSVIEDAIAGSNISSYSAICLSQAIESIISDKCRHININDARIKEIEQLLEVIYEFYKTQDFEYIKKNESEIISVVKKIHELAAGVYNVDEDFRDCMGRMSVSYSSDIFIHFVRSVVYRMTSHDAARDVRHFNRVMI